LIEMRTHPALDRPALDRGEIVMNKDKSKSDDSRATHREEAERMIDAVTPTCHAAIRRAYIAETLPGSAAPAAETDARNPNGRNALR
jgi:hypothetical protein